MMFIIIKFIGEVGSSVAEWLVVRAPDLKSRDPEFKSRFDH